MNQLANKKPDSRQMGIEAFALAREWIFKPYQEQFERSNPHSTVQNSQGIESKLAEVKFVKPWKASELYLFLDELHTSYESNAEGRFSKAMEDETDYSEDGKKKTSVSEKLRKRYEPYLKEFSKKYNFPVSFQDKTLDARFEEYPMTIIKVCRDYIEDFAYSYSPEALELVVRNWNPMGDVLYFLIILRYAIQKKVRVEFEYESTMKMELTRRKVIPFLVTNIESKLSLIAKDIRDGEIKSFPISRIKNVRSDLRQILAALPEEEEEDFDFSRYKKENPNATFHDQKVLYEIELSPANLNFLRHTKTLLYRELDKKASQPDWKVIQVETHRERDLFDLLFNYGTFAKLLSPPEAVAKFKKKLDGMQKFYES